MVGRSFYAIPFRGRDRMPSYEYECNHCGKFTENRPLAQSGDPAVCPQCDQSAARVISPCRLSRVSSNLRMAHQVNERSADHPSVTKKTQQSCGCGGSHGREKHQGYALPFSQRRPWMLSH
ncbi:FmdB family zinc ribbon protein [Acidithiobacillus ferrianus]|uniref:FmdB family zinc ribbon protein n=1 Tax=Acidithiobacillus ferrianus TaxID=2678518 RepID=UPI0034E479F1